jgi:hypothetical protein
MAETAAHFVTVAGCTVAGYTVKERRLQRRTSERKYMQALVPVVVFRSAKEFSFVPPRAVATKTSDRKIFRFR